MVSMVPCRLSKCNPQRTLQTCSRRWQRDPAISTTSSSSLALEVWHKELWEKQGFRLRRTCSEQGFVITPRNLRNRIDFAFNLCFYAMHIPPSSWSISAPSHRHFKSHICKFMGASIVSPRAFGLGWGSCREDIVHECCWVFLNLPSILLM